jgi:hypothetical protein
LAQRTCTATTGCSQWFARTGPAGDYALARLSLQVAENGDVYVENPNWFSPSWAGDDRIEKRKRVANVDIQLAVKLLDLRDTRQLLLTRVRIRATRDPQSGVTCLSMASPLSKKTNAAGVVTESFWTGVALYATHLARRPYQSTRAPINVSAH